MRPLDRWILPLGVLLLAIAAAGSSPKLQEHNRPLWMHAALLLSAAAAGAAVLLRRRLNPVLTHWVCMTCLLIYCVEMAATSLRIPPNLIFLSGAFGYMLQFSAAPAMWGLALSRREAPSLEPTQRLGRVAAGLVQVSFIFLFISEIPQLISMGSWPGPTGNAWYGGSRVLMAGERVLLLWASVLCMRTPTHPSDIQRWAGRIHHLMLGALAAGNVARLLGLAHVLTDRSGVDWSPYSWFWDGALLDTLTVLAALTIPLCFRRSGTDQSPAPAC